jgi:thymidylate kinase
MRIKTGIICVVLGSDGSGKGSVLDGILSKQVELIDNRKGFHWRPGSLPSLRKLVNPKHNIREDIINPQSEKHKNRNRVISFIRWFYYSLDYIIGYYFKILPLKRKGVYIFFDRYYYDYFVDPIRYGFHLPQWLFKSILPLIPKPDLTIYLDNDPEELFKRKQELPIEELRRQVNAWREFIPSLPNAKIVTTDKPLEEVVNEVTRLILERRAEMTRKILKIEPEESRYLWSSNLTDYIALPSKKNCRWMIPANPKLAKKVWDLYLPHSFKGKVFKSIMQFISAKGFLKVLKFNKLNLEPSEESETLKKCIASVFKRDDLLLALSTGTPGPFRKITAMILSSDGTILGYAKIGETEPAIQRIKNEAKILKLLVNSYQLSGDSNQGTGDRKRVSVISYPECLFEGEIDNGYMIIQSPPPFEAKSGEGNFNEDYARVLGILIKNSIVKKKFVDSEFYKNLKQGIETYPISYRDILEKGLKYLKDSIGEKEIAFALSHGDFAPWNMLWSRNKENLFLFDWESACLEAPAGIDLIHFLFQTGFLLKKQRGKQLLKFIKQNILLPSFPLPEPDILILLYSLHMAVAEDRPQLLSPSAVERRKIVKLLVNC